MEKESLQRMSQIEGKCVWYFVLIYNCTIKHIVSGINEVFL
jgi:hypothetical protein